MAESFTSDVNHGKACASCHGGDPAGTTRRAAHAGMTSDPTARSAASTCGGCHAKAVADNVHSFHTTLEGIRHSLVRRGGLDPLGAPLQMGFNNHCASCHSTCGNCHLSTPSSAGGGLLKGHLMQKTPDLNLVCTACHGSRVGDEFKGLNKQPDGGPIPADVHFRKGGPDGGGMHCVSCHSRDELHGVGQQGLTDRYQVPNAPRCRDCHPDDVAFRSVFSHGLHRSDAGALELSCQVCHATTNKSCYSCHVSRTDAGVSTYVVNADTNFQSVLDFKVGLNPRRDALHPEKWVALRHTTGDPENFKFYGPDLHPAFTAGGPTWRMATPHNIQRVAPQAASCDRCHGQRQVFLGPADLKPYEVEANRSVVIPDALVPRWPPF